MLNVGIYTPNPNDSTSLYRAYGPWSALKNKIRLIPIIDRPESFWHTLCSVDILYSHRPFSDEALQMIQTAKNMNIPVWVDLDDAYFNLDYGNPAFEFYQVDHVRNTMQAAIESADVLTVSTDELKKVWSKYNSNIHVIKNEFPLHLINKKYLKPIAKNNNIVCWRGTENHLPNLLYFQNAIIKSFDSAPYWCWVFMGIRPTMFINFAQIGRIVHSAEGNQWRFFEQINSQRAKTQIVMLKNTIFSRSKSNIAWQESLILAQSLCVVPDFAEWNNLNATITYKSTDNIEESNESLHDAILAAYKMPRHDMHDLTSMARNDLIQNLQQGIANKQRLAILNDLINPPTVDVNVSISSGT